MPRALRGTSPSGRLALGLAAVFATGVLAGCSNPSAAVSVDAGLDHVTISTVPDAITAPDSALDAAPLGTSLRVALLSSLGFGVDVCVTEVATEMTEGPLLFNQHQLQTRPDAGLLDGGSDAREAGHRDAGVTGSDASQTDATVDALLDAAADASEAGAVDSGADAAIDGAHDAMLDATRDAEAGTPDAAPDGGTPFGGVLAEQVTNYLSVMGAGTFDVAIVAGGSPTCGVCPLAHRRVTLDAGKLYTLVVGTPTPSPLDAGGDARAHGDATVDASHALDASRTADAGDAAHDAAMACPANLPLTILPLVDEPTLTSAARARFFNATSFNAHAPEGGAATAFRVAVVEQSAVVPLATNVPPGHVALANPSGPGVDSLGYWSGGLISTTSLVDLRIGATVDASADAVVEGGVGAPSWTFVAADDFDLAASTDHTGFIAGGAGSPLTLLWCNDTTTIGAVYTSCEMFTGQ